MAGLIPQMLPNLLYLPSGPRQKDSLLGLVIFVGDMGSPVSLSHLTTSKICQFCLNQNQVFMLRHGEMKYELVLPLCFLPGWFAK